MTKDIRVTVGLADHHKTVKLIRKCGDGAFRCLIRLWCYAAENRPSGALSGMDRLDIAIASGWSGDENTWVDALVSVGFIEDADGALSLHDWEDHNPFAFHATNRSQKAKTAARSKWGSPETQEAGKKNRSERLSEARKKGAHTKEQWAEMVSFFGGECVRCGVKGEKVVKDHIEPIYQGGSDGISNLQPLCQHCNSSKGPEREDFRGEWCLRNGVEMPADWNKNACGCLQTPAETPTPSPSPSPSPNPSPLEEDANASLSAAPTLDLAPDEPDELQRAFDTYNITAERCGLSRAQRFDNARKSKLRQRLKECGGLSGWVAALEKLEASSFCRGANDQGWRADFDFLMQAKSFTRLMEGRYDDRKNSGARQRQQKPTHDSAKFAARSGILEGLGLAGELEHVDGSPGPRY